MAPISAGDPFRSKAALVALFTRVAVGISCLYGSWVVLRRWWSSRYDLRLVVDERDREIDRRSYRELW